MNWRVGFRRLGWTFIGLCWIIFVFANQNSTAAQWGEYVVYMLFFTGALIVCGRILRWVIRGFTDRSAT